MEHIRNRHRGDGRISTAFSARLYHRTGPGLIRIIHVKRHFNLEGFFDMASDRLTALVQFNQPGFKIIINQHGF